MARLSRPGFLRSPYDTALPNSPSADRAAGTVRAVSSADDATPAREYHHVLHCPCGKTLTGDTEDDIVEVSFAHLRAEHADLAETYEREHILFMALRLPK